MDLKAFRRHAELEATAVHIITVQRTINRLVVAKNEAWGQLLAGFRRAYLANEMEPEELAEILDEMKASYGEGFSKLWNRNMPKEINHARLRSLVFQRKQDPSLRTRYKPNGPTADTWTGCFPIAHNDPIPPRGTSVVYVLFDANNEPAYVGSTENFLARMKAHCLEKPGLANWIAYRCRDRNHAYQLEDRLLKQHMPRLNRKCGR